ncbi:MAG: hypothetical protein AB2L24_11670 [Mangrovibacterium sp.]
METQLNFIRVKDIPLDVTLGDLSANISKAYKIMAAIHEGRTVDAFNLANEILKANDAIVEQRVDKDVTRRLMKNAQDPNLN